MSATCVVCKQRFSIPNAASGRTVLLRCPHCGFIGLWSQQQFTIPTYQEEQSLERLEGELPDAAAPTTAGEQTVAEQGDIDLPLPYKRTLWVKILTGPEQGGLKQFNKGRAVVGRQEADIALDDVKVSRKHAAIEAISRENIFVRDLASTNGTYLNGTRVQSKKLRNGDIIRVGQTELQFLWQDED